MIGGIKNFRFWCQKVLPLVYDNSLSYYEILCKVVHYLNHVIDDINQIPEYIDEKVKESLDDEHLKELISEVFRSLEDAISDNNEGENTHFSTDYPNLGTLVWHDNKLYQTIRNIDQGDEIIPDVNIELVNFGDMFNNFLDEVKENFTEYDDGKRETASANRTVHQLIWLDDVLYEVSKPIAQGNAYIYEGENTNVVPVTLDVIYQYLLGLISSEAQTREEEDLRIELSLTDLITSKVDLEAQAREEEDARIELELADLITSKIGIEAQARENEDTLIRNEIGDLNNLTTRTKLNIVSAINELDGDFPYLNFKDYGAVGDGVTDNYSVLMDAIADMQIKEIPLFIPAGVYLIDSPVVVPVGFCQIIGAGMNSSVLKYNSGGTFITLNATSSPTFHDIKFRDLRLITTQLAHCFNLKYINGGTFENIYVKGFRNTITAELAWCINVYNLRTSHSPDAYLDAHFYLKRQCNAWNFIGCFSSLDESLGTNQHVFLQGDLSNINFYGCVFEFGYGIVTRNTDGVGLLEHININGCYFEWMQGNCFRNYSTESIVQNVKISNCYFNALLDGILEGRDNAIDAPEVDGFMVDTCYQTRYGGAMIRHARGSAINYDYRCNKTDSASIPVLSDGVVVDEGAAAPSTGYHQQGYFRRNTKPTGATPVVGWVCTAAGTPGTFVAVTAN